MTTITLPRAVVEQALEVINDTAYGAPVFRQEVRDTITALRAALAQQAEPVAGCETEADCTSQPWCRIRGECQRKQAEPVAPHRWEGDHNIESPFNACMHKSYCMTLKRAEPLNLSDPAVQKRLATQWGYVPAAQAEPVEPVAWVASKDGRVIYDDASTDDGLLRVSGDLENDEQRIRYAHRIVNKLNAAPPQRKLVPLTDEEIYHATGHCGVSKYTAINIARVIEEASWEKNHGQA